MTWKIKTYDVESEGAILLHNGQLADPLNEYAKALKDISGKRKKTEADFLEMSRIEFLGSLYTENGNLVLPADMWNATIINAAKTEKMGKTAKAGVIVRKNMVLDIGQKTNPTELFKNKNNLFVKKVNIKGNSLMRTRPKFDSWKGKVEVQYEDGMVNEKNLDKWIQVAGQQIGLGDWRPVFGRFKVVG